MVPPPVVPDPVASMRAARPKSATLAWPLPFTMTFSGLISRCRVCSPWATSRAWETAENTAATTSSVISSSTSSMICASVLPSTYSMIT